MGHATGRWAALGLVGATLVFSCGGSEGDDDAAAAGHAGTGAGAGGTAQGGGAAARAGGGTGTGGTGTGGTGTGGTGAGGTGAGGTGAAASGGSGTAGTRSSGDGGAAGGSVGGSANAGGGAAGSDAAGTAGDGGPTTPPPNDTCDHAVELTTAFGSREDVFDGATAELDDCGAGGELFYKVTLADRGVFYVSTLGSSIATALSVRERCGAAADVCDTTPRCSTQNQQLALDLPAGTHYFAVHAAAAGDQRGTIKLDWASLPAPSGDATRITSSGSFQGMIAGSSKVTSKDCSGGAGPENLYFFTLCSGEATLRFNACPAAFEPTLYARDGTNDEFLCGDSGCGASDIPAQPMYGPGLFGVYVDARYSGYSGTYTVNIVWN